MAFKLALLLKNYSDNELVNLACNKDSLAMDILLTRYDAKTKYLVYRYVQSKEDVQDIAQEVLIKLYQSLGSFRQGASFNTWHYRIVMNTISSYFRDPYYRFTPLAVNYEDFDDSSINLLNIDDPNELLVADEMISMLLDIFDSMPTQLKETIILYEIEDLNYAEIAEKLKIPIGTIRSRLHRARQFIDDGLAISFK